MEFLQDNVSKLIFSSIAALVIGIISKLILEKKKREKEEDNKSSLVSSSSNAIINFYPTQTKELTAESLITQRDSLERRKSLTKILFIDDDTKFKVVNILQKSGWINTTLIKDIHNVDDQKIKDSDIFFVDIQGVGKELACKDEGLGLALILRKKYKNKKIVIYSAETKGDRFHEALTKADSLLAKNAEPYEFQELVEQYSLELYPND
jgi:hypothetical protein